MAQQKQCNKEVESFVDERCQSCGKRMTNVKYIWVDENDSYICQSCKNKYNIDARHCDDLD
jgi:transposase-like protein